MNIEDRAFEALKCFESKRQEHSGKARDDKTSKNIPNLFQFAEFRVHVLFLDERDRIQKKTFTKWVNKHLQKSGRSVEDLFVDLQNGRNLIALLEALSAELLVSSGGRFSTETAVSAQGDGRDSLSSDAKRAGLPGLSAQTERE